MNNASIKSTARVDTFTTTSTVGALLTEAGLPPADYYAVDFHEEMGELITDTIHNEDTDELLWDGNDPTMSFLPEIDDDKIVETVESYLYAAYSDWA